MKKLLIIPVLILFACNTGRTSRDIEKLHIGMHADSVLKIMGESHYTEFEDDKIIYNFFYDEGVMSNQNLTVVIDADTVETIIGK